MSKMIVAFCGLPRVGKGTAAEPLVKKGFLKASFGDPVYQEVAVAFGVKEEELRSDDWKNRPINLLSIRSVNNYKYRAMLEARGEDLSAPRTSRYHLQRWATDYRRAFDPLYWVRKVDEKIRHVAGNIVIDDLRFVDTEYAYLRNLAATTGREFKVIEVQRPSNVYTQHHISDTPIPFHLCDFVVENRGEYPEVLQHEVLNFLYPIIGDH